MVIQRTDRLNSLLQEVIAEVIMHEVRNPKITTIMTVKKVEITKDLHYAKVYISMLGSDLRKTNFKSPQIRRRLHLEASRSKSRDEIFPLSHLPPR